MTLDPRTAEAADFPELAALFDAANTDPARRDLHSYETPVTAIVADLAGIAARGGLVAFLVQDGAVALDVHADKGRAWAWGPGVVGDAEPERRAAVLLDAALSALPSSVRRVSFYLDARNTLTSALLDARGGVRCTPVHIYVAPRPDRLPDAVPAARAAGTSDRDALHALHEQCFPGTYASADELLARDPAKGRVFVLEDGEGGLAGYVAVTLQDDGTGYVDYVATVPARRGQGVAGRLLGTALRWLFADAAAPSVSLTVADDRATARGLYERAGFHLHLTGIPYDLFREPAG